jgi:hypothetical protein
MVTTHNVTIERDKEWFAEHLPMYTKMWKYVTYFRDNQDKANIVFEYIASLGMKQRSKAERDNNDKIMKIYDTVCNEPDNEAPDKEHKKYAKYIAQLINDTQNNLNKNDKVYWKQQWKEIYEPLYAGWDKAKILYDYINSLSDSKKNKCNIVDIFKSINAQPGENDSHDVHIKYTKMIKDMIETSEESSKTHDDK